MQPAVDLTIPMALHNRTDAHTRSIDQSKRSTAHQRPQAPQMQIGPLPRYHPSNFPSANPALTIPSATSMPISIPKDSSSPRPWHQPLHQSYAPRQHTDAPQRQLYAQQKDNVNTRYQASQTQLTPNFSFTTLQKVMTSPRLHPREVSPGPMTPLDLEERDGYLWNSAGSPKQLSEDDPEEIMREYTKKEAGIARSISPAERRTPRSSRLQTVKKGDVSRHRTQLSR